MRIDLHTITPEWDYTIAICDREWPLMPPHLVEDHLLRGGGVMPRLRAMTRRIRAWFLGRALDEDLRRTIATCLPCEACSVVAQLTTYDLVRVYKVYLTAQEDHLDGLSRAAADAITDARSRETMRAPRPSAATAPASIANMRKARTMRYPGMAGHVPDELRGLFGARAVSTTPIERIN